MTCWVCTMGFLNLRDTQSAAQSLMRTQKLLQANRAGRGCCQEHPAGDVNSSGRHKQAGPQQTGWANRTWHITKDMVWHFARQFTQAAGKSRAHCSIWHLKRMWGVIPTGLPMLYVWLKVTIRWNIVTQMDLTNQHAAVLVSRYSECRGCH